jgi:hypothetical protein
MNRIHERQQEINQKQARRWRFLVRCLYAPDGADIQNMLRRMHPQMREPDTELEFVEQCDTFIADLERMGYEI